MICKLDIKIEQREKKSYLKDAYVTQPFRIVPVGQYRSDNGAYLMIMSSSPGLLDGDDHQINIQIASDASLHLQTQAYQRLFQMKGESRQHLQVKLGKNASFSYVPHPIVPQQSATFYSKNELFLEENCLVVFGEIITCGRKLSGEEFKYNHFQNLVQIYDQGKLVVKDNILLKPDLMPLNELGLMEGYTHQGSFLCVNNKGIDLKGVIEQFYEQFHESKGIEFGISALEHNGFMVRVLGMGAEQIFNMFKKMEEFLWDTYVI